MFEWSLIYYYVYTTVYLHYNFWNKTCPNMSYFILWLQASILRNFSSSCYSLNLILDVAELLIWIMNINLLKKMSNLSKREGTRLDPGYFTWDVFVWITNTYFRIRLLKGKQTKLMFSWEESSDSLKNYPSLSMGLIPRNFSFELIRQLLADDSIWPSCLKKK